MFWLEYDLPDVLGIMLSTPGAAQMFVSVWFLAKKEMNRRMHAYNGNPGSP
jgi:hypothetical protein